jgi:hypothetical protein
LVGSIEKTGLNLDTKVLSEFIYALNIARRQILSYPPGHPVINAAAEKLLFLLPQMFEFRQDITIGVARDTLLVGNQALDNTNPIYRDFAKNLFDAKVASLTINKDVTTAEICKFFELLRYKPEDLADRGGLHRVLTLSDIKGLSAQGVDFGAFHATEVSEVHAPKSKLIEDETVVLWKSFVGGLVAGTLDPNGEKLAPDAQLDPELLAEIMNREEGVEGQNLIRNYEEAITSFLKETDRDKLQSQASQETLCRLGDLVGNLKPDLRRRFLNSTLKSCSGRQEMAGEVLSHLPQAQILEAMEQVDNEQLEIPQSLMDVLGKLGQQGGGEKGGGRVAGKRERSSEETTVLLGQLFSADQADKFVPEDYQDALTVLAAAETLPGLDRKQVDELVETLDGHAVERHLCNVMFDLLDRGVDKVTVNAISRNMEELIFYFLETGDFVSLINVHDHLSRHARQVEEWLETPEKSALCIFSSEEFVEQVLDGLDTWGKAKYGSIKSLIKRVKKPFVVPLLDLLVQESSMSKRRLFMECLHVVGSDAREQIEARLHDRRWFFVRNLVILLRGMEDSSVLKPLGRLVGYANSTVQFEVMRTFIHFKDPRADRYLLKELDSKDPGVLLQAARLAANSRSPEVASKLSGVLNRKLLKETDENVKSSVIKALAEMALPEALPGLRQFLHSRSLLQSFQGNTLKIEAVKTLGRYDSPDAVDLAEEVYRKASGELARTAGQVCLQKRGKLPWT